MFYHINKKKVEKNDNNTRKNNIYIFYINFKIQLLNFYYLNLLLFSCI